VLLELGKIGGERVDAGFIGKRHVCVEIELVPIVVGVLMAQNANAVPAAAGAVGTLRNAATCSSEPGS